MALFTHVPGENAHEDARETVVLGAPGRHHGGGRAEGLRNALNGIDRQRSYARPHHCGTAPSDLVAYARATTRDLTNSTEQHGGYQVGITREVPPALTRRVK
jgi:hypothetical protein